MQAQLLLPVGIMLLLFKVRENFVSVDSTKQRYFLLIKVKGLINGTQLKATFIAILIVPLI